MGETEMDAAMLRRDKATRFQHTHPRCASCRKTEEAWQDCIVSLHRERAYVKRLEHATSAWRERLYDIYHRLPSRRTKLAKQVLAWVAGPDPWPTEESVSPERASPRLTDRAVRDSR